MKSKLSIFILLILLLTVMTTAVYAADYHVAPGGDDNNDCLTPTTACLTIQAAVNKASPGDIINVAAGTYDEDVNLNKSVSLLGAGANVTTIRGVIGGDGATVRISASNVTIAGFTITRLGNNLTDWNNTGLNFAAIAIQGTGFTGMTVRDNILTGNRTAIDVNNSSGHTIRNNVITFNRTGLLFRNQTDNITFVENEVTDNWTVGILFLDASSGTNSPVQTALNSTFSNNNLSGNWYGQIVDRQTGGSLPAPGTTNLKNFSGNWFGTIAPVVSTADSTEPGYSSLIPVAYGGTAVAPGGQPDILGPASANFDYTPYLNAGTDTDIETTLGRGVFGFQGDYSNLWVTAVDAQTGTIGRVQEGVDLVSGSTVNVAPGTYTENVNVNKALHLRGSVGGDFSGPVLIAEDEAPAVWYTDRYAPGVFETYDFGGEMVLRHGVREADSAANRPPAYSSTFYNYQGRKLDTNLTGPIQSMSIDVWVDSSWNGAERNAGLWATGFDTAPDVSAYPIMAWRSGGTDPEGFYAFDYINGGWLPLMMASAGDYGRWHTLSFAFTVGTGVEYFVNGESTLTFADPDTTNLGNVILNVYNYGADYDVYWDNFIVGSDTPATHESVVNGLMTISASNVDVTGLYLTNPGQTYAVLVDGSPKPVDVRIANNRIQDVGSTSLTSNVHAVYVNRGPDDVTIANNSFNNIKSGTRSVSAVGVLDSASTDASTGLVIANNTFTDIASNGRGAYGIIINNAAGAPGAQILDNAFSGLSGSWTHAVGLEGPTPNAVVTGNRFSDLTAAGIDNSAIFFEANPVGDTVTVNGNLFNGPTFYGVAIHPNDLVGGANDFDYEVDATSNWWGSPCGPSAAGVDVGPQVIFSPWWGDPTGSYLVDATTTGLVVPDGATTAEANAIFACAPPYGTVDFEDDGTFAGGIVVTTPGLTIKLNGGTVGPGSPAFTIEAPDVTITDGDVPGGVLDGNGDDSPAVLVNAGGDNFTLEDVEVREWANGVEVAASVTSFKLFDNWIHSNTGAGLQVNSGVTLGGVVSIQGNLFKANGGNGIQHDGNGTLPAEYNSWGHVDGPASGDGVSANVDADPWTFAEVYMDVEPDSEAILRAVNENDAFDVALKVEAENLYGLSFVFSYDDDLLTYDGLTFNSPWAGTCLPLAGLAANEIGYQCALTSGPEWDGGTVATLDFTADLPGILPDDDGPWSALLDISHLEADTSAGALNGAKVFVNNAGFNDPSDPDRDITDNNDGQVDITGLANFTGFVDLQGRANDSGAVVDVFDVADKGASVLLAQGTSAAGGGYTTAYQSLNQLYIGGTYYFQINRPLYLPTTILATLDPINDPVPEEWANSADALVRPLTTLNTVVLLGGDATNDDLISIGDASCIGGQYGLTPGVCGVGGTGDVNEDGVVNILDLTLMGGNFDKDSSPWAP